MSDNCLPTVACNKTNPMYAVSLRDAVQSRLQNCNFLDTVTVYSMTEVKQCQIAGATAAVHA